MAALLSGSLVVYATSVIENPNSFYDYATFTRSEMETVWLARYGVIPSMMLLAVGVVAVSAGARGRAARVLDDRPMRGRMLRTLVLGGLVVLLLTQFVPQTTRRSAGPAWLPEVTAQGELCEKLPDSRIDALAETIGWKVRIDCGVLEAYG